MGDKMECIRNIAKKLADYNEMLPILQDPYNCQNFKEKKLPVYDENSLSHGLPAVCMLFAELSELYPNEDWDMMAHQYLYKIQKGIEENKVADLSMFSGYAGIGLAVECLSKKGTRYQRLKKFINGYMQDTFPGFMDTLSKSDFCFMRDYDVISGLSGILGYTIWQEELREVNKRIGEYLVKRCQYIQYGQHVLPGFYIPQKYQFLEEDREHFPQGNFNLGFSHGVPGILTALCILYKNNIDVNGIEEAIEICSEMIVKFEDRGKKRWGAYVSLEEYLRGSVENVQTRDAWCYGSPGVCYALYIGGVTLGNEKYKCRALEVMRDIAGSLAGVYSPTFCHGYAGVAYIYWRFYEMIKSQEWKNYSTQLMEKAWEFYDEKNPFGFQDVELDSRTNQIGLLSGVSGVLLPLLAAETKKKTRWDCAFLLGDFN